MNKDNNFVDKTQERETLIIDIKKPTDFNEAFQILYNLLESGEKTKYHEEVAKYFNPPKSLSTIRNYCLGNIPETNREYFTTIMADEIIDLIEYKIDLQMAHIVSVQEVIDMLVSFQKPSIKNQIDKVNYENDSNL